jgi:heavy metal translocating P-type ATPase
MMHALRRIARFLFEYKLLGLSLVTMITGLALELMKRQTSVHWVLGTISIIAVLPILREMWEDLRSGRYGIDILAVTAIVTSVVLHQYWAAIVIVVMFTGGEALEDYAGRRAKTELDALLSRVPEKASVIRKGKMLDIPVREVRVGDIVVIKPGDVVPVDATILEGAADFDESSLTGESLPQQKQVGDQLLSGSVNINGAITAKCVHIAAESQYEQIIKLVRSASASQAPVVRLADRYSVPFTLAAYSIALAAWFFGHHQAIRFLEVIVVATPCPLLLAAPIAVISGISRAAKHGIIVKTGTALEQLAEAKTIGFDKTGTLTTGVLTVDTITAYKPYNRLSLLGFAASLEQGSNHVLAQAIVDKAEQSKIKIPKAKHITEASGLGLSATVSGHTVMVGRLSYLQEHGIELPAKFSDAATKQTATYAAVNGNLAGFITFSDTVRPESNQTIAALHKFHIQTLMVTGDNKKTAQAIAKQLNLGQVYSEALPADKLHVIERITDRPVAFVGDGVNDAPVLTAANIGIALGVRGSTAASESADMVIMLDDISKVAEAVRIAKRTFKIAQQSILGGIALSVILMAVFATGKFPPLIGALLQELVDVIVIFNALRAHGSWKRAKPQTK